MIVDVARLPQDGDRFTGEEDGAILDVGAEEGLRVEGPVRYDFAIQLLEGELIARGVVEADVSLCCSRCARRFSRRVADRSFLCVHEVVDPHASVELTPDIREAIILALPAHPVCSEACKGLCPRCGADLGKGPCGCRPPDDGRWKALNGLSLE